MCFDTALILPCHVSAHALWASHFLGVHEGLFFLAWAVLGARRGFCRLRRGRLGLVLGVDKDVEVSDLVVQAVDRLFGLDGLLNIPREVVMQGLHAHEFEVSVLEFVQFEVGLTLVQQNLHLIL